MAYSDKQNWKDYNPSNPNDPTAIPAAADFNRIEKGVKDAHNGDVNDNSISSIKLKTIAMADRIKLVNLHEEVLEAMTGETGINMIPSDGSVTLEKFAPELQGIFIEEGSGW